MLLLLSVAAACIISLLPLKQAESFTDISAISASGMQVRRISAIRYAIPDGLQYEKIIFPRSKLLLGKMMLLDQAHPLPDDALPPNTASIVMHGNGMVPVRSLELKTGRETIDALKALFSALKSKGISGIYVRQGSMSRSQQRLSALGQMRMLMKQHTPDAACEIIWARVDRPGTGELMQEYAVDFCLINPETNQPDERPLEETAQGQHLLQLAWRYGWIRTDHSRPHRFRYVGKAHATAMTYLDVELADYLTLLHQRQALTISAGGKPQYLILCQPLQADRAVFELPADCQYEVSLDNLGYAVAACTLL